MAGCAMAKRAKPEAAVVLELFDHLFCEVLVFADQNVDMVRHNRACVASASLGLHNFAKCGGDFVSGVCVERQQRMPEDPRGFSAEVADFPTGRLNFLPSEMQVTQVRDRLTANHF
jgi:hypothetical protein